MLCDEVDSKSKSSINSILYYGHLVRKDCTAVFTTSRFPYVNSVSQFSDAAN